MQKNSLFTYTLLILSSLVLLFILAPLGGMLLDTSGAELLETVTDKDVQQSIWRTLWISFAATFFFAFGSVPLAWLLARKKFPGKSIVQGIIDLPVVLPHTAAGIAVLGFISRDGMLGKAADTIGLTLINNPAGIALAMAFLLGLINAIIRPILVLLSCGCIVATLGLFMLVINTISLLLAERLGAALGLGFNIDGFWPAFYGSVLISVVSWLLSIFLIGDNERK